MRVCYQQLGESYQQLSTFINSHCGSFRQIVAFINNRAESYQQLRELINSCQHLSTVTDKRYHLLTFFPLMMYAPCGRAEKFFALPTTLPVMSKTSASGSTGSEMEASEMEETVLGVEK